MNSFHMRCLRNILTTEWQDRTPDVEVLRRAGTPSLYPILRSRRLRWIGHVAHMDTSRIPKQILYEELSEGSRDVGGPKLRFKDQCITSMIDLSITVANWDMVAQDGLGWRAAVLMGAKSCEDNRVQHAVGNRQRPSARQWIIPQYSTAVGIVRNRANRELVVCLSEREGGRN